MDLTPLWLRCLKTCRDDLPTNISGMKDSVEAPIRLLLPRSMANDPYTLQATNVLAGIQRSEALLTDNKAAYIDAQRFLPSRAAVMTDAERDQLDQVFTSFIVNCGSQIQIMQCALSDGLVLDKEDRHASKHAHQKAMVTYLSERLQDLNQAFVDVKAERKRASRFRLLQSNTAPPRKAAFASTGTPGKEATGAPVLSRTQPEVMAEEAASRAWEGLSGERLQRLEVENKQLEAQFQNELTELRQVEARMVELSQLLGLFTGKLQEQQEHVDEIHEAAIGTTINVEKGNQELMTTIETNQRTGRTFVIAVIVLSLFLLVLDQIIP